MEEIALGLLQITARIIGWFLIDIFVHVGCWSIGWVTMKIFTLGHYPKKETNEDKIALVGFFMLLLVIVGFTMYVHFNGN